jgi:glycosyltransferase involved in cell wall biosynthesis
MKVLMLAPQPFFKPRGTPFSVYHRCRALTRLGHQVDLLTYHLGEDVSMDGLRLIRIPALPGIRNVRIGFSAAKLPLWVLMCIWAVGLALRNRYDLVHTHEDAVFIGVLLRAIGRMHHLYDMHSSLPQQFVNYNVTRSRAFLAVARAFERLALRFSDAVITICPSLRDHVLSIQPGKHTVLIENVALTDGGAPPDEALVQQLRERLGGPTAVRFVYTGTLEFNQGIDLLLQALELAVREEPAIHVALVGGEPEQVAHFRQMAEQLGVTGAVTFTGRRPVEEMASYMAAADVLVSPRSIGTNTPLKLYSYMQAERAILATDLYTHTQVLNPDVALLVGPTPECLAEGMVRLARDPELRRRLGRAARELQQRCYSYEVFLDRTRSLYDHIARKLEEKKGRDHE